MPPNSEIEKLERRWKENPKGTVFAPYAEVLRKHGDHLLARDVLRQGLELHPDHIPGNIVLGRCCLDLVEDGPAEAAFNHVLELDQENVIALKALADITERQGRLMEASGWLSRLIAVDPSNDEARDQLARVDSTREAAAAAMSAPLTQAAGQAPEPSRAEDVTEALPTIHRNAPPPAAAEVPAVEVAVGHIMDDVDADAVLDAHFTQFEDPPAGTVPMGLPAMRTEEPATSAGPAADSVAPMVPEIEEFERAAESPSPEAIANFDVPVELRPEGGDVYSIGQDEAKVIELRPSSASEFQSPDDSLALLDLAPTGSEFQVPDASSELTLSSAGGAEYQAPSGSDELLRPRDQEPDPQPEPDAEPVIAFEPEPVPQSKVVTTGFAAITLMPTQEMPAEFPPEPIEALEVETDTGPFPEPAAEPAMMEPESSESLIDLLAASGVPADAVPGAAAESGLAAPDAPDQDLKLIFPEDAAEPEPARVRRISEEAGTAADPAPLEPGVLEPAPVLTESMAELYVRQGHLAEAINVYAALLARQPDDQRLEERLRELQASLAAGGRRLSYVAMETGGESVESFFRSLADARPAGSHGPRAMVEDDQAGGAPTRPANDPLSLSAIFGEEAPSTPSPSVATDSPAKPQTPDAFSFDQFFGAASSGGASGAPGGGRPPQGEDLDQFQHWLKSLKK